MTTPKKVRFSTEFRKQFSKSPPKIHRAFEFRLNLFLDNPDNPILNNHHLMGRFKDFSSINVTGDWRAIYSVQLVDFQKFIVFELLGTHSQLYG